MAIGHEFLKTTITIQCPQANEQWDARIVHPSADKSTLDRQQ